MRRSALGPGGEFDVIRRILKFLAYASAAVVVLLASMLSVELGIAVALFELALAAGLGGSSSRPAAVVAMWGPPGTRALWTECRNGTDAHTWPELWISGMGWTRFEPTPGVRSEAPPAIRAWDESRVTDSDEEVVITQTWGEIRRFMWNYVGIVRTTKRLERAKHRIEMLRREVRDYYAHFRVTPDLIELRNLVEVADLIIRSALARHESRGLHYTLDYPRTLKEAQDTVLVP